MSCDHWKRKSIHPSIQPYIHQSISVPIATRRIIICGNQMWRDRDATSSLGGNNHFHKLLSTLAKRLSATRNCPPHPSVVPPAHLPVCLPTWRSTSSANRLQFLLQNQVQLLLLPSRLLLFFFFSVSELRQLGLGAWLTVKVSRKKWTQSCSWPT